MKEKDLMYNPSNGKILITNAKEDGKVYKGYLMDGYFKIGTASGFNMCVKGLVVDEEQHDKVCTRAIKKVIKDVKNEDIDILGDWLNRVPTPLLKVLIS